MKKKYAFKFYFLLLTFLVSSKALYSQSVGDIAIIAFNADANDEFAFVALADIPANTSIWFTDNGWNGIDRFNNLNEGEVEWNHTAILPAGSIVVISSNATLVSGLGTVSGTNMNFSATSETLYALLNEPTATTAMSNPGFLTGFSNNLDSSTSSLANTGLTVGVNFIDFDNGRDGFKYTGDRSTETSFSDYLPLIMNLSSWQTETTNGANILPIDTTSFSINEMVLSTNDFDLAENEIDIYISEIKNLNIMTDENKIVDILIYNMSGQLVKSSSFIGKAIIPLFNFNNGIYIVQLTTKTGVLNKKIVVN